MTDNSNAAPERIWALPDLTQEWAKDGGLGDRPYDHLIDGYTEYIRADLASAQVAAAYERAAEIAGAYKIQSDDDYSVGWTFGRKSASAAIRALAQEDGE